MAVAEAEAEARYVYVQTTTNLWRFDFQGTDTNEGKERGALTHLIDFCETLVPLGAGGFVWNSKLFFVGGEAVKTDTPHVELYPCNPFDTDEEFDAMYDFENDYDEPDLSTEEIRKLYHNPEGFLKLPRSSLNKQVFVADAFYDSNSEPNNNPSISITGSESLAPKTWPLVVPITKGDKTLVYVIAHSPLVYKFRTSLPSFEVYDPALDSWEQLDEPPYTGRGVFFSGTFFPAEMAFELAGKIFLFSAGGGGGLFEMCFDVFTKKWECSHVFRAKSYYVPMYMIKVSGDVYIGCKGLKIFAYKYCPGRPLRIQGLSELQDHCRPPPDWRYICQPHSQLCHLGNGLYLFVCSVLQRPQRDLNLRFCRFKISELSDEEVSKRAPAEPLLPHVAKAVLALPFAPHDKFVSCQFVDSFDKRVAYKKIPTVYEDSVLNLYSL